MVPSDPCLLISMPLCISQPLTVGWTQWLTFSIQQKWWAVTSEIRPQKDFGFSLACPILLSWFLTMMEAKCQVVSCPGERLTWQKTESDLPPAASKEPRPSVYQSVWNLWTNLKADHVPVDPSDKTTALASWWQPSEQTWARGPSKSCLDSWPTKLWDINIVSSS